MNIKNEETHRLVRELVALTGESQTTAITQAVRERLERLQAAAEQNEPSERVQRMKEIVRDIASRFTEEERTLDHGELLYDENGLPK